MASSKATGAVGGALQGASIGATIGGGPGAAIGAALGGVVGLLGGGGEDEAKALAKIQEDLINITSFENQRRMREEMEFSVGKMRAQVAASNILIDGSPKRYIDAFQNEALSQIRFESRRAKLEGEAAALGGEVAADSIKSASLGGAISSFGSAAGNGLFGSYSSKGGYTPPEWLG